MADPTEERAHWRSVLKAFDGYMQYHLSANNARRMAFLALPKESKVILEEIGYRQKLEDVDEGIRRNAEFFEEMIADPVFADMMADAEDDGVIGDMHHSHSNTHDDGHDHAHDHNHDQPPLISSGPSSHAGPGHQYLKTRCSSRHAAQDKVRSTLRSFVRDWSEEGAGERKACYTPCLEALDRHFVGTHTGPGAMAGEADVAGSEDKKKPRNRRDIKVLVPGCGLGRLAMEIAARGFASQGNEFSTYMLLASHWVLNQTTHPRSHAIHPYLHSFSNHLSTSNLLRSASIPDVCPADILGDGQGGPFSLIAGDFVDIYGSEDQKGQWGSVVTCFFIDCARNILRFLRTIYDLLEDGGIWINIGPLLWHFENSPTSSTNCEGSIELSLDEVKILARKVGFEIKKERIVHSTYTGMPETMLRHEYQAAFWTATKLNAQ